MLLDDINDRLRGRKKVSSSHPSSNDDMGLGEKIGRKSGVRLINQDGTFNVERRGNSFFAPYQALVEMSWRRFMALVVVIYFGINVVFALAYLLIGVDKLANVSVSADWADQFAKAFFFSVQTFTTVGYGAIHPIGSLANLLASVTALTGLLCLALATGLVFARFSRPRDQIIFSQQAILSPYLNTTLKSLQFRIASRRDTNLINMRANVVFSWLEAADGSGNLKRRFAPLKLERKMVALFPLNWTIVHPIDEHSPINGWSKSEFCRRHSEILIMIEGYDKAYAQSIHANSSYTHDEVIWNARFKPMYFEESDRTILHLDRIDHLLEEE